jgi:hypothetical protein
MLVVFIDILKFQLNVFAQFVLFSKHYYYFIAANLIVIAEFPADVHIIFISKFLRQFAKLNFVGIDLTQDL